MNGLNTVMIIGKLHSVDESNNAFYISMVITNEDGDMTIPITINEHLFDVLKKHSNEDDLIGIKGCISVENNQICIIATKVTLLSRKS